jgi:hypothetical protein
LRILDLPTPRDKLFFLLYLNRAHLEAVGWRDKDNGVA